MAEKKEKVMKRMFRLLRADEIECRVSTVKENGCSLLLYKDARCDQNILDETVGNMNWQRKHSRDNANCTVGIWDTAKKMWVEKEDTGTESYTEKEKGLASDSFKRACFNWGIGRELYTAPFIWIGSDKCKITKKGQGWTTFDRFDVHGIGYDKNGNINHLIITNRGKKVFVMGKPQEEEPIEKTEEEKAEDEMEKRLDQKISEREVSVLSNVLKPNQVEWVLQKCDIQNLSDMTARQFAQVMDALNRSGQVGK